LILNGTQDPKEKKKNEGKKKKKKKKAKHDSEFGVATMRRSERVSHPSNAHWQIRSGLFRSHHVLHVREHDQLPMEHKHHCVQHATHLYDKTTTSHAARIYADQSGGAHAAADAEARADYGPKRMSKSVLDEISSKLYCLADKISPDFYCHAVAGWLDQSDHYDLELNDDLVVGQHWFSGHKANVNVNKHKHDAIRHRQWLWHRRSERHG
jgi:hypothetical protein